VSIYQARARIPSGIALVLSQDLQKVLLVKRTDVPVWVLPGGGIDPGEQPDETARREALEESGYEIEILRKGAEYSPYGRFTAAVHVYVAKVAGGKAQTSDETSSVRFYPLSQLPKDLFTVHKGWIGEILGSPDRMIQRPLKEVTLLRVFLRQIRRPQIIWCYIRNTLRDFAKRLLSQRR